MRTIYGQSSSATADASSAGAARARRLCAGLVVAGALFGSAAPAHADDGLAVGGLTGGSIDATVATVQSAAVAQASAIVNDAVSAAASTSQPAPAPAPSEPQTGSASGVAGGISSAAPTAPAPTAPQPPAAAPSAASAAPATSTEPVVAPSAPVVSQPPAADTPPASSPEATAVPSAAFHRLAREYQKNPGRYHSLNSLPISRESGAVSSLQSLVKRAPFTNESSAPNPSSIPASTCQESTAANGCGEPAPRPSHAHVGAVANTAPVDSSAATDPDALTVGTVEDSRDRAAGLVSTAAQTVVPHPVTAQPVTSRPAARAQVQKVAPAPAVSASTAPASAPRRVGAGSAPLHVDRPRSPRVTVQTQTAEPDAAAADRSSESIWPWLGLALLLAGLTSISLAVVSVGADGAAAVSALAARVRTMRPSVTAVATRMRSKGLSAGANHAVADRTHERRGIRYRD